MDVTTRPASAASVDPPRFSWWVTCLDAATVVSAIVCVSNVAFDGFRLLLGPLRITADSTWRVVVVLAVAAALRHWLWRTPSLPARLVGWALRAWRSQARPAVLAPFVLSRVMVAAIGFMAIVMIGFPNNAPPFRLSTNELVNLPVRWDAGWYLQIALNGYEYNRATGSNEQQNIAFFPAYPLLSRTMAAVLGMRPSRIDEPRGNEVDWRYVQHRRVVLGGMIVTLASFGWALVYLYRLARELLDSDAAEGAVLMASAWPYALFFSAMYTEALFLLVSVAAFYHLRRGEAGTAAVWGLLAGLSRPNGFLLSLPLGLLVLQQLWSARRPTTPSVESSGGQTSAAWSRVGVSLFAAAAPVVGMVLFSAFLYDLTGRPLAWMDAHRAWGRVSTDVNALLSDRMTFIVDQGLYSYSVSQPLELLNAVPTFLALALAIPVGRRLGLAYALLVLVMILPPLARGGFLSLGRLTSTLFPLFLYLGWALRGRTRAAVVMVCGALQAFLAVLFFTWRPFF